MHRTRAARALREFEGVSSTDVPSNVAPRVSGLGRGVLPPHRVPRPLLGVCVTRDRLTAPYRLRCGVRGMPLDLLVTETRQC